MGSVIVAPGDASHTATRRNIKYKDGLVPTAFAEVRTQYDCFQRGLRVNPNGNCHGTREDTGTTKEETDDKGRKKVSLVGKCFACVFEYTPKCPRLSPTQKRAPRPPYMHAPFALLACYCRL